MASPWISSRRRTCAPSITPSWSATAEFDSAFVKIKKAGIPFYGYPNKSSPGEINTLYGGRGIYFEDPSGHLLELITTPYGEPPAGLGSS